MCGINGFVRKHGEHSAKQRDIGLMNNALLHRGPDNDGTWSHQEILYFGHRRLSIIDLSSLGSQPMLSQSGKSSIILNGEIYNFKDLAKILSVSLKGSSDTEVLLEYIEEFGVDKTLQDIRGMYAFAYFNSIQNKLFLARDPFGEKPLYYGKFNNGFYFSSELKAFHSIENFKPDIDETSVTSYLNYGYVAGHKSIYKDIYKLKPASFMSIDLETCQIETQEYVQKYTSTKGQYTDSDVLSEASRLLDQSVQRQLLSDVPLGVFLSSGIDSSLIAARMTDLSSTPIQSFSIGFESKDYDESTLSKEIAKSLGLQHSEYICTSRDLLDQVTQVPDVYDEPFSDSSQIPTMILSNITRKKVTVALSGDGGDEVFGGYNRYKWLVSAFNTMRFIPKPFYNLAKLLPVPYVANKIDKLRQIQKAANLSEAYELSLRNNHLPELHKGIEKLKELPPVRNAEDMMQQDQKRYLPDDILVKMDRASMAHSLETRAPYLDLDLYNYVSQLPMRFKIRNGETKWLLRRILAKDLNPELISGPKKGFAVPIDSWLRNELKEWTLDLLSPSNIDRHGYFNNETVQTYLHEHLNGTQNRHFELWNLIVFQAWFERWR